MHRDSCTDIGKLSKAMVIYMKFSRCCRGWEKFKHPF